MLCDVRRTTVEWIKEKGLIFDGAMGSMLIREGLQGGECPELWNLTKPEIIQGVHRAYFDAGAGVATTNTFGASRKKLEKMQVTESMEEIIRAGVRLARAAATEGQLVAGDLGTPDEMLPPMGTLSRDEAVATYREQAEIMEAEGVDLFVIETVFDLNLALAGIEAVRAVSDKPIFCTLTFNHSPRGFYTLLGNSVADAMPKLVEAGASVVGANCSMGSDTMVELAKEIRAAVEVPIMMQPNAGLPIVNSDQSVTYPESVEFFVENIKKLKELGVEIVGGCCGTTPDYISGVAKMIKE